MDVTSCKLKPTTKNITNHSLGREIPPVVLKYQKVTEETGYNFERNEKRVSMCPMRLIFPVSAVSKMSNCCIIFNSRTDARNCSTPELYSALWVQ